MYMLVQRSVCTIIRNMKYVLLFLCIFWIGCSCKNIPCYYEPNNELECIEFIEFPGEQYGCSYTNKSLVFTGSSKLIGKELWIQVQKNQETFYVRRQDGACKDKCCDTFNRVDRAHHHEDHCASQPCVNGGRCHNEEHDFVCTCKPGFYGTHCHHHETYHYISYGQQHVNLVNQTYHFISYGQHHVNHVNHCASKPCNNGGTCHNEEHNFVCTCPPGFKGTHCHQVLDCGCHHGKCFQGALHRYHCKCDAGYTGAKCETVTVINHCHGSPCAHGLCLNLATGFMCFCYHGYTGLTCKNSKYSS
ncbi:uncharacterized protein LOC143056164 [Mytilus galloprovincialis]|uniref:uncharacterized protein LOC143056164 n=1 Tax=Mytilus galloprovincialis TaxID=29158 RepID=UPI003F7B77E2